MPITCWDCQRSHKFYGFCGSWDEPPEEPEATCTDDESEELYMEEGEEAAAICPRFLPYPSEPCANHACHKVMYLPQHLAPYRVYGVLVVCSPACAEIVTALIEKEELADDFPFLPFSVDPERE